MTIKFAKINHHKKCLEIETPKGLLALPFSKLRLMPSSEDPIVEIYVDEDLASEAVTYKLKSGLEDSIHVDAFLDYNEDPDYMKKLALYNVTIRALELVEKANISKREIARRLSTSPPQLYRLLDTSNYSKSIDQMVRLIAALGCEINFIIQPRKGTGVSDPKRKFKYLRPDQLRMIPEKTYFKPLLSLEEDKRAA